MKRLPLALAAAVLLLAGQNVRAQAPLLPPAAMSTYQPPQVSPYNKPPISPWLNLARPGSNPAINYYGLVQPQVQTYGQINQLQGTTQLLVGAVAAQQTAPQQRVLQTGHTTRFMSYNQYFNSTGMGQPLYNTQPFGPTMLQMPGAGRFGR